MKVPFLTCAVVIAVTSAASSSPVPQDRDQSKFFFDGYPKGISLSRVTEQDNTSQPGYSVTFVPLITVLAGMFPNFMSRLGQFTGVSKYVNTRRFDLVAPAEQQSQVTTTEKSSASEEEEDELENELIECDSDHLGLWPDKSDSQRYYKCEIDPRTPTNCFKDLFKGRNINKPGATLYEKMEVPGVRPCFLLSMMKCANGFKYQHKTRICVPDIVFAAQSFNK